MFITIDKIVYVTTPDDRKALNLLKHTKSNHLQRRYVTIVSTIGAFCLAPGLLTFVFFAVFYDRWQTTLAGAVVFLLSIVAMLALGKATIIISRDHQEKRFKKYILTKHILRLPDEISHLFLELLSKADSSAFLPHYRPNPYDLADLKSVIEDCDSGLDSAQHAADKHRPVLVVVVARITKARKEAEEESAFRADALHNLPRPSGD